MVVEMNTAEELNESIKDTLLMFWGGVVGASVSFVFFKLTEQINFTNILIAIIFFVVVIGISIIIVMAILTKYHKLK